MKFPRRQFLHLAAGAAALPTVSHFASAQAYPTRPIRLIAPFPAGGSIDLTARLIGQWLTERLGQQFVIENRSGAAGWIERAGSCSGGRLGRNMVVAIGAAGWLVFAGSRDHEIFLAISRRGYGRETGARADHRKLR
jgi:tripartite-type tricarboxylate transporter receptor subunit TctC